MPAKGLEKSMQHSPLGDHLIGKALLALAVLAILGVAVIGLADLLR
jgi:hypothetical protein